MKGIQLNFPRSLFGTRLTAHGCHDQERTNPTRGCIFRRRLYRAVSGTWCGKGGKFGIGVVNWFFNLAFFGGWSQGSLVGQKELLG